MCIGQGKNPLDDLLEDLERVLPAESSQCFGPTMAEEQVQLVDLQTVVSALIYEHTDADFEGDQRYQDAGRRVHGFFAK